MKSSPDAQHRGIFVFLLWLNRKGSGVEIESTPICTNRNACCIFCNILFTKKP